MDKASDQEFAETPISSDIEIEADHLPACIRDTPQPKLRMKSGFSLSESFQPWEPVAERPGYNTKAAGAPSFGQMSEFAKRIEDSAASSSAWERIGGESLSKLRSSFQELLGRLLSEFDNHSGDQSKEYAPTEPLDGNGDIILAYRFAGLLASALAASDMHPASRIEVGCNSRGTEFTCFLGDRCAGISVRKKDNLFALCTNGDWLMPPATDTPHFATIKRVIQNFGGDVCANAMDGSTLKVSFQFKP